MKNISILSQELDYGTLKFIRFCYRNKFIVKYLLISPSVEKHPLRIKQDRIRGNIFRNKYKKSFIKELWDVFLKSKVFILSKKLFYTFVLFLFQKKYALKVEKLENDFSSMNNQCFEYLTVIYSLEGIISANAIQRFRCGIINIHPAPLPSFRGLDGGLWALKAGHEVGVSAYIVDKGIDTGPIINFYPLVNKGKDLPEYIRNLKKLKQKSYIDAINRAFIGDIKIAHPIINKIQNRGLMPEIILKELYKSHS